jgi:hypothetical protein
MDFEDRGHDSAPPHPMVRLEGEPPIFEIQMISLGEVP